MVIRAVDANVVVLEIVHLQALRLDEDELLLSAGFVSHFRQITKNLHVNG